MDDLIWTSATDLAALFRRREISPVEVVDAVLDRLEQVEPSINAFVTVTADAARRQAKQAEARFASGEEAPALCGIPVTVKDLTDTAGVRTTYGCRLFADHVPAADAISWERMKRAGAILIGKTTTPEFGLLGVTDSHLTGSTNNPWDLTRVAGGSSGGAAASVAAGVAPLALGSDGGGSIRVPASCCGVVGVKPSIGRIPTRDNDETDTTEGPLTRTVADAALLLQVLSGPHREDRYCLPDTREDFAAEVAAGSMTGLRIAYSPQLGVGPVDRDTRAVVERALAQAEAAGAHVDTVQLDLPDALEFFVAYWGPEYLTLVEETLQPAGESWALMDDVAARARKLSAPEVSSAFRATRTTMYNEFRRALTGHDVVISPTTPSPAILHSEAGSDQASNGDGQGGPQMHLHRYTEPPTHAGLPALSIPAGFTDAGLPVGLHIIGPLHADGQILRAAAAFEAVAPWADRHPLVGG